MNLVGRKFNNPRLDIDINVYDIDGKQWFIGKEVTDVLGYKDSSQAIRKSVSEHSKRKCYVETIEITGDCPTDIVGKRTVKTNMMIISVSGFYQLVLKSNKDKAVEFQEWVCDEVLPSLQNNGYVIDEENISKEQFERLENDYLRVKGYLFDLCGMGKISLGRASELIFGNDKELRKRLMNLGWIDYENCKFTQQKFKNSKGEVYELFVCNVSGTYNNGVVKHSLQVSITNAGYVWLKDKFEKDNNLGLKGEE